MRLKASKPVLEATTKVFYIINHFISPSNVSDRLKKPSGLANPMRINAPFPGTLSRFLLLLSFNIFYLRERCKLSLVQVLCFFLETLFAQFLLQGL